MVKQRSLGPDNLDDGSDGSSAFLDALRTRAMDDLHEADPSYVSFSDFLMLRVRMVFLFIF